MKLQAQPTTVLISSRIDEKVDKLLDPQGKHGGSAIGEGWSSKYFVSKSHNRIDQFRLPFVLDVRPPQEFDYSSGKRRLTDIQLPVHATHVNFAVPGEDDVYESYNDGLDAGYTGRQGKLLRLASLLDFDSQLSVGCAGALLTHLQRRRGRQYLPGDMEAEAQFRVTAVEMFNLNGTMLATCLRF